jgi:hypothetical protein
MIIMKGSIVLFIACFVMSAVSAQSDLTNALGSGNVAGISAHFGSKVELTINDREAHLSKPEAETRLKEFYSTHQAKGFKAVHSGNSKSNESNYTIGELLTDKGNYRVYIYFTSDGGRRIVAELRIEK